MNFDRAKLFSTRESTEVTITACGETFPVYVRRLPAIDLRRYHAELNSPDVDTRANAGFEALHKSIRNEDGSAFASIDEYRRMDGEAIREITKAFSEVNTRRRDDDLGNA